MNPSLEGPDIALAIHGTRQTTDLTDCIITITGKFTSKTYINVLFRNTNTHYVVIEFRLHTSERYRSYKDRNKKIAVKS